MIPHTLPALSRAFCRASLTLLTICATATAAQFTVTGTGVINSSSGPEFGVDGETVTFQFTYDDSTFTRTTDGGSYSDYSPAAPIPVIVVGSFSGQIEVDPVTVANAYNDPGGNFDQWNFFSGYGLIQANSWSSQGFTSNPGADFAAVNATFVNGYATHWSPSDNVSFGKNSLGGSVNIGNATWTIISGVLPPPVAPDTVFVANEWDNTILKFTAPGVSTVFADSSDDISNPVGMVFDSLGNLFVANSGNSTVVKITPNGTASVFADYGDGITYPTAIAIDSANNLYVGNSDYMSVVKITPSGTATTFGTTNGPFIRALAVDQTGKVYVACDSSKIEALSPAGVLSLYYDGGELWQASGLTFDSTGILYCSDYSQNKVLKFSTPGSPTTYATDLLSSPLGIRFGASGKLYVANQSGYSVTSHTTGGVATTFAENLNGPSAVAIYSPPPAVNLAPTEVALSPNSIDENNAPGATVGTLQVADLNPGDTHTFSFVAGGADNTSFTLTGAVLKITPSADYETKNSYAIRIRATDSGGLFVERDLTISINDLYDTPIPGYIVNSPYVAAETLSGLNGTNGYRPSAITRASDGNYYIPAYSSIIKVTPAGVCTNIGNFNGAVHGGQLEGGVIMAGDGNLYGAALAGGTSGTGTVYRLTPAGVVTKLADFNGSNGAYPCGSLILASDGAMYGLTMQGGANNVGVVYKVTTAGVVSVVASLSSAVGTAGSRTGLVQGPDGALYGLGANGGAYGQGTVFKVTIGGSTSIAKIADLRISTVGGYPDGTLAVGPDGALYGTLSYGGVSGVGTAIRVTTGGIITRLVDFTQATGSNPSGALVLAGDGNFYGQTNSSGPHGSARGTVFRLSTSGVLSVIAYGYERSYSTPGYADAINGSNIRGLAVAENGSLFGVAAYAGPNGYGSVFRLNAFIAPSTGFIVTGEGSYIQAGSTGAFPGNATLIRTTSSVAASRTYTLTNRTAAPVTVSSVTKTGSSNISLNVSGLPVVLAPNGTHSFTMAYLSPLPDGDVTVTVASNSPTTPSYQFQVHGRVDRLVKIADMDPATTGVYPRSDLLPDGAGNFYAMTNHGTTTPTNKGMAIKVTPAGAITPLASISAFGGGDPYGHFIQGPGGLLYGFTATGGSGNSGTFFKMTPAGVTTLVASLSGYPYGTPVLADDGNFYGLTRYGGPNALGTIFRVTPAGVFTQVFAFTSTTGTRPTGSLIKGSDGALYGMTAESGANSAGTIFKFTTAGVFTKLTDFNYATTGGSPQEDLIQASDGNFYGITISGGANNEGTIFRMTPAGVLTKLADFNATTTGRYPEGSLFEASDGNFYGLTRQGGAGGAGTVFRLTPAGVLTTVADFDRATNGAEPLGSLVEGSPGLLYGTASRGGAGDYGTIFKVLISVQAPPPNQDPTDIALSTNLIAENNAPGASVGTLTATDADVADTHTFELVAGGMDNGAFTVTDSSLKLTPKADFETKSSYVIRIRATDSGGLFVEKNFTITITDANDAPTFAGYSASTPFQKAVTISLGKLLAKASDVEGDALAVSAAGPTSTQGGTAVVQGGSVLYTPATGFSGVDTFPVTITDARGASVAGTVTVNVQINTGIGGNTPVLTSMSGGQMGIGFQGIPGRSYQVQRSTDLNNWTTLSTVTAAANGAVTFIDISPPPGSAFYRLRRP